MRLTFARSIYSLGVIALAINFVLAYRQADHVVWSGVCFGIAAFTFMFSEWLQLRHEREVETLEHADLHLRDDLDRNLIADLDLRRFGNGGRVEP